MSFLKKHYEKIVLAILLIVFVVALILQLKTLLTATNITADQLKLPVIKPDYTQKKFSKPEYNVLTGLDKNDLWKQGSARIKKNENAFTNLLIPFKMARCYHCNKIIPREDFTIGTCSLCGGVIELSKRPRSDYDGDRGGIPDKIEVALGMNPDDPADDMEDTDKDGFPNAVEFEAGTDMKDKKSHPPLVLRLTVESILRKRLPLKLKKVMKHGDDRSTYQVHLEIYNKKKWRTKFPSLNSRLVIDSELFKLVDIRYIEKEFFDKSVKALVKVDKSQIVLERISNGDTITCTVGETVYDPKEKVKLRDRYNQKTYRLHLNSEFDLGGKKYTLTKLRSAQDKRDMSVVIAAADGGEYKITHNTAFILKKTPIDTKNKVNKK